jgi:hypothetical protein
MILEVSDHRILAALRCVDGVTGMPLREPFRVSSMGCRVIRNRSGLYVIHGAPAIAALHEYSQHFDRPPAAPPSGESWPVPLTLHFIDPTHRYLPRQVLIPLPRVNAPTSDNSIFRAVDVPVYPSPSAPISPTWAVVRATLLEAPGDPADQPRRLPWAWIGVARAESGAPEAHPATAFAQADWRGEALIAVAGIPAMSWDGSSANSAEVSVRLDVVFDSRLTPFPENVDWSHFQDPNQGYVPNPDTLNGPDLHLRDGQVSPYRIISGRAPPDRLLLTLTSRS